ncbi:MAG: alpha/beta hydrolase [Anaerolineae bacterium]|nr:alpha/beta hydrolase [Anaerolineae bacterium]
MIYILFFLLALLFFIAFYTAVTFYIYHRVPPQKRACLDCNNPVKVNGFDLYYRENGVERDLPPVVLVHGGPGHSSLSFKDGLDFLSGLTRLIYYDQRGSGNSEIKPDPSLYKIESLVEELENLRRDVVKREKMVLIGHSFGSALLQRYALKYPRHVEKMIIVGGIRINNSLSNRFFWRWFGPALYSTSLGFPPAGAHAADEWFTRSSEKDNPNRLFDKTRSELLKDSGRLSFAPWREISLSLAGPDYKKELACLPVPTLFIYGVADSAYTGQPVAAELNALMPNCKSQAFEHSGHWPFLEEPQKFRDTITAFLRNDVKVN